METQITSVSKPGHKKNISYMSSYQNNVLAESAILFTEGEGEEDDDLGTENTD